MEIPRRRRLAWGIGIAAALILLIAVPWRLRVTGPARVLPGRRAAVTAGVDGTVLTVLHREGDKVRRETSSPRSIPQMYGPPSRTRSPPYAIADSDVARYREAGDSAALFEATSKREELKARIALEQDRLARTRLVSPAAGVIVTPRIEERVGQYLTKGNELCVVADVGTVIAEVAVPENDATLVQPGEPVAIKLNPYPTRLFRGTVMRPGTHVRQEDKDRFIVAEVRIENADGLLKTGMQGQAKVSTVRVPPDRRASSASPSAGPGTRSGPSFLEHRPPLPQAPRRSASRGDREGSRPTPRPSGRETGAPQEPRHPAAGPDGRGAVDRQEPGDDEVSPVQERQLAAHPPLRRHSDPREDPGGDQPAGRSQPVSLQFVLEYEEFLRDKDLIEQSAAERSLNMLDKFRTLREKKTEEKAEGFNIFFIMFHVLDPDRFLNRTIKYVWWIWTPPVAIATVAASIWTTFIFSQRWMQIWTQTMDLYHFLGKPILEIFNFFAILCVIACIHEFSHAYASKRYGGECHDIGFALLLLHARLLLRHVRRVHVQESAPTGSGSRSPASTAKSWSARSRRRSGWRPTRTRSCTRPPTGSCCSRGVSAIFFNINPLDQGGRLLRPVEPASDARPSGSGVAPGRRVDPEKHPAASRRGAGDDAAQAPDLLDLRRPLDGLHRDDHALHLPAVPEFLLTSTSPISGSSSCC